MSVKEYKVEQELDFTEEFKEIIENLIEIQKCAIRNIEYREFDFGDFLNYCLHRILLLKVGFTNNMIMKFK